MSRLGAVLLFATLIGVGPALGEGPSQPRTLQAPGALPRVDRNSVEGVREWMEFIGILRYAQADGMAHCPNRVPLLSSLGWGAGRAAFADYLEAGDEAQRLIATLFLEESDALRPFCFSSNPCIRDFARRYFGAGLVGRAKSEGVSATPPEQEAIEAAVRRVERPISPITGIGAGKWVDDFAVAEVYRSGSGCVQAGIVWRDDETLQPFVEVLLYCY